MDKKSKKTLLGRETISQTSEKIICGYCENLMILNMDILSNDKVLSNIKDDYLSYGEFAVKIAEVLKIAPKEVRF